MRNKKQNPPPPGASLSKAPAFLALRLRWRSGWEELHHSGRKKTLFQLSLEGANDKGVNEVAMCSFQGHCRCQRF